MMVYRSRYQYPHEVSYFKRVYMFSTIDEIRADMLLMCYHVFAMSRCVLTCVFNQHQIYAKGSNGYTLSISLI